MAQKIEGLHPDYFYRKADGPKFFGYGHTQIDERIKSGDIPMPASLSDTGRAKGWFGQTIIDWQNKRKEEAREKEEKLRRDREEQVLKEQARVREAKAAASIKKGEGVSDEPASAQASGSDQTISKVRARLRLPFA